MLSPVVVDSLVLEVLQTANALKVGGSLTARDLSVPEGMALKCLTEMFTTG